MVMAAHLQFMVCWCPRIEVHGSTLGVQWKNEVIVVGNVKFGVRIWVVLNYDTEVSKLIWVDQ
jgi:hypothetical protein